MDSTRVIGVYLAAGVSRRMGQNKLNLPLGNTYLGSIAFKEALESKLDMTIAVLRKGVSPKWLSPFTEQKNYRILECENASLGQSHSLKKGINAAENLKAAAVIVLLGDQPLVPAKLINLLIDEFAASPSVPFIACLHKGIPKPPVLLSRCFFRLVQKLEGDQGARVFLNESGRFIEIEDDDYFFDADTQDDYQFLLKNWGTLMERKG
ncbi:NTP transferase domain-containing protein [Bacillus sp. BRMEA1]|uniref:nucleotidyltransferase family protein n=1 Tax=Neobacillus endophyticus TaxID=2738405 RepID=UPI00156740B6|nr:nucleotidyltransferase family protein [Neobacillus endophyticus]NRD79289.1 NTP transferase domain-containing protein [Neobacillus endophyticus]